MHLRVSDKDKVHLEAIAARENRDISDTLRGLIKLGLETYMVTGNLYVKDVLPGEERPADGLGKEQRQLVSELSKTLDRFASRLQSMFKKEKTEERGSEWQQAQNK